MRSPIVLTTVLALAACNTPAPTPGVPGSSVISLGEIETDAAGNCFANAAGPKQTTIINEQVEVVPEVRDRNGVVVTPAIFRNVTRPQTVEVGKGPRFETLCPQLLTPELVGTLQRALIVRRAFQGVVNGTYDEATSQAVQQFQRGMGIDSPLLAVATARDLGIVAVPRTP